MVDVYRGEVPAQKSFLKLATYVSLFPQLVAGPIVRYSDISKEIDGRKIAFEDFSYGVRRFILGLAKKVLIANMYVLLFIPVELDAAIRVPLLSEFVLFNCK